MPTPGHLLKIPLVGITSAVATLDVYISALLLGLSLWFSTRPDYSGNLLGTTVLIILSIYMGPVARQVDYYQAIHSIICCAYNHSYHCDFNSIEEYKTMGGHMCFRLNSMALASHIRLTVSSMTQSLHSKVVL
jgi:hypothetical protein